MANKFDIIISATDKATTAVRRVNDNISRITRPIREIRRATTSLGRELGFGKIAASFGQVHRSAAQVAGGVQKIVAPMAAVVGIGSIAGVAALAKEWGHMGIEVKNTAQNLGVATSELQSLRGAARMAGVSAESLTSGLLTIGDTLNDAKWGRNQPALAMLRRLGVGIHMTAEGSIDAVRGVKDLSSAIGKIRNVETQRVVARMFGAEQLLPLLRKGPKAIEAYQKKMAELGGVQSQGAIDKAAEFGLQLTYLGVAADGLKSSIAEKLVPALMPFIEKLTTWVSANRELIASKVADFVKGFAEWLEKVDFDKVLAGCTTFITKVGEVVDSLGGWKTIAMGVGAVMAINLLAPVVSLGVSLTSLTVSTIPAAIRAFMALRGASMAAGAAGAAGGALPSVIRTGAGGLAGLGLLGQAGAVGAAGASGYLVGTLINWGVEQAIEKITGSAGSIGTKLYDFFNPNSPSASTPGAAVKYNAPVLDKLARDAEKRYGLPSNLLVGIKNFGERSNSDAVSPRGAKGVMQFMPDTWAKYGKGDPTDAVASIDASGRYFQDLMKRYGGNVNAAIVEYNGGVKQAQAVQAGGQPWAAETQNYLARVTSGIDMLNKTASPSDNLNAPAKLPFTVGAAAAGQVSTAAAGQGGGNTMEITLHGLPAGVSATATSRQAGNIPVRVATSMPTLSSP